MNIKDDFNNAPEHLCVPILSEATRGLFASDRYYEMVTLGMGATSMSVQTAPLLLQGKEIDFFQLAKDCPSLASLTPGDAMPAANHFSFRSLAFNVGSACYHLKNIEKDNTLGLFRPTLPQQEFDERRYACVSVYQRTTGRLNLSDAGLNPVEEKPLQLKRGPSVTDIESNLYSSFYNGTKTVEFCIELRVYVPLDPKKMPTVGLDAFLLSDNPMLFPRVRATAVGVQMYWPRLDSPVVQRRLGCHEKERAEWLELVKKMDEIKSLPPAR